MIEIKNFKNKHKNQDIYILASGKSLDFFNLDFFNDKISIGINQIYKIVDTNYLIRKEFKLIEDTILKLKHNQFLFVSEGNFGCANKKNKNFIETKYKNDKRIVLFKHENNKNKIIKFPNEDELIVSSSTITSGIHLAAYMGAKNILLVGHDCGSINGEFNCSDYHNDASYKISWKNGLKDYKKWIGNIERDTIKLKKMIKEKYNCEIYSLNPFINFGLEGNKYKKHLKEILLI